jgi:hypothetical protein
MATIRIVQTQHLEKNGGKPGAPFFSPVEALRLAKKMVRDRADTCPHHTKPPAHPKDGIEGMCAHVVACNYGFLNCGAGDAISLWRGMPKKYRRVGIEKMRDAPAGALLFWEGGSQGHGHVAMSDGKGHVLSTDLPDTGFFGRVKVDDVTDAFKQTPKGWTFPFFELAITDQNRGELRDLDLIISFQRDSIARAKKAIREVDREKDKDQLRQMIGGCHDQIAAARSIMAL